MKYKNIFLQLRQLKAFSQQSHVQFFETTIMEPNPQDYFSSQAEAWVVDKAQY